MIFEPFAVVIVPFPFIDVAVTKARPAVVLSCCAFNDTNGHTLLAMITTAARSQWPSDQPIKELDEAGLRTQCVVRFKLFTLENRMIERSIGSLGEGDREAVSKQLSAVLG